MSSSGKSILSSSKWKWAAALLALVALIAAWFLLPVKEWGDAFQEWIKNLGAAGILVFGVVYVVATVLMAPVWLLTVAAGLAFGIAIGFPLVVVSATVGATLAFVAARYLVHERIESMVASRPKLKAVKAAVSEGGWKVVGLLRLSPVVPFNLQNYFYGVTDIKLVQYVPATFFGIMPGTLLYVYLGAAGKAVSGGSRGLLQWTFLAVGLIATIAVTVLVTRKAREKLKQRGVGDGNGGKKK